MTKQKCLRESLAVQEHLLVSSSQLVKIYCNALNDDVGVATVIFLSLRTVPFFCNA